MIKFLVLALFSLNLNAATVLFVGDSHSVGPFGWALDQHLRDAGHSVGTYASCGSIPRWFSTGQKTPCGYFEKDLDGSVIQVKEAPTPMMDNLLSTYRPDVVIMEFGGNYITYSDDEFIKKDVRSFVSKVKATGAKCLWVTNPDTRKYRDQIPRISSLIKEAVGEECPIFESHLHTRYPETGGDGVHYWNTLGTPIAKAWALKVFEMFKVSFNL